MTADSSAHSARQSWLGILARADAGLLHRHLSQTDPLPSFVHLRQPEIGLTMVRGRVGAEGEGFNLIEATLTRASIVDDEGHTGHAYVLGRDEARAVAIARLDAALQSDTRHAVLMASVVDPLAAIEAQRRAAIEARAAGTEVHFFTMATGR